MPRHKKLQVLENRPEKTCTTVRVRKDLLDRLHAELLRPTKMSFARFVEESIIGFFEGGGKPREGRAEVAVDESGPYPYDEAYRSLHDDLELVMLEGDADLRLVLQSQVRTIAGLVRSGARKRRSGGSL